MMREEEGQAEGAEEEEEDEPRKLKSSPPGVGGAAPLRILFDASVAVVEALNHGVRSEKHPVLRGAVEVVDAVDAAIIFPSGARQFDAYPVARRKFRRSHETDDSFKRPCLYVLDHVADAEVKTRSLRFWKFWRGVAPLGLRFFQQFYHSTAPTRASELYVPRGVQTSLGGTKAVHNAREHFVPETLTVFLSHVPLHVVHLVRLHVDAVHRVLDESHGVLDAKVPS
mmetsp:Transcript_86520/g.181184  ORF Transcript_86520/g.181184 Transcript_86520/m.181184 type:complete len:226 (+) Transcript_86520:106-783(+)